MSQITWDEFEKVEIRVGTVVEAAVFPEARIPAYVIHADFGPGIGVLKSSARITENYSPEDLVGRRIVGVVNFPPKQIGPLKSQFLVTGFPDADGAIVLAVPDGEVPDGSRLA